MVEEGHQFEVDLASGTVRDLTNEKSAMFAPFSDQAIAILEKGGLIPYLKASLTTQNANA